MDFRKEPAEIPGFVKFMLTNLMLNFCAKPDFISYNHKDQQKRGFRLCRKLFGVKTAAWTIRSEQELDSARQRFDVFIFDSFLPYRGERVGEQ